MQGRWRAKRKQSVVVEKPPVAADMWARLQMLEGGLLVRGLRMAMGWTHKDLAAYIGANERTVQRWEAQKPPEQAERMIRELFRTRGQETERWQPGDRLRMSWWASVRKTPCCWLWSGPKWSRNAQHSYGRLGHKQAHRVGWELLVGPIPEGAYLCHTCDMPQCVNPAHLYVGNAQTNNRDREQRRGSIRCGCIA